MTDETSEHSTRSREELREFGLHFTELAQALSLTHEAGAPLDPVRVVRFAATAIPHTQSCSLTLMRGSSRPQTVAATGKLARQVDELQYAVGEGPSLEASEGDDVVLVHDLAADDRWPAFASRCAADTGVRSMLSLRLFLGRDDRAAVNFYGTQVGSFSDADIGVASMFAPFAALAVQSSTHERDVGNLENALATSRQIGTAIGILMAHHRVTSEEAFDLLRGASQNLNRKLHDIAAEVELTGALPTRPDDGD